MNKNANLIMNILIILLILALVFVMMNYYAGTPSKIPTKIDVISEDIIQNSDNESIITNHTGIVENSGETIININTSGEIVDVVSGETSGDVNLETSLEKDTPNEGKGNNKPVIMTSENEISNKEKKEVLTELDKTLMELLDVVDKVQTVDETRLIIDDSEVQQ